MVEKAGVDVEKLIEKLIAAASAARTHDMCLAILKEDVEHEA